MSGQGNWYRWFENTSSAICIKIYTITSERYDILSRHDIVPQDMTSPSPKILLTRSHHRSQFRFLRPLHWDMCPDRSILKGMHLPCSVIPGTTFSGYLHLQQCSGFCDEGQRYWTVLLIFAVHVIITEVYTISQVIRSNSYLTSFHQIV